jgi:hypothetical protein
MESKTNQVVAMFRHHELRSIIKDLSNELLRHGDEEEVRANVNAYIELYYSLRHAQCRTETMRGPNMRLPSSPCGGHPGTLSSLVWRQSC